MKTLYWLGLTVETAILMYYLYQIWIVASGRSTYVESYHAELIRKNLVPAVILGVIISGALVARFYFKAPKIATYIVLSPVFMMVLAFLGMIVASMFIKNWR